MIHHGRIRQGAGITQGIQFIGGDLAQDTSHDLAGPGLGKAGCPLDDIRAGNGPELYPDG